MQVLHAKYPDDLCILAFPCNAFGGQEPHDNITIKDFAENRMGFKGLVLGKLMCDNGRETHPFYAALKGSLDNGMYGQGLKWNFAKFLCDANGIPHARYSPQQSPLSFENDIIHLMHGDNVTNDHYIESPKK